MALLAKLTGTSGPTVLRLAQKLSEEAQEAGTTLRALVQVNVADEETKSGFERAELVDALGRICEMPGLRVEGLMTMAPFTDDEAVSNLPERDNTGNTYAFNHHGELYMLREDSRPYRLDPETLETVEVGRFENLGSTALTAHPKIDPKTGEPTRVRRRRDADGTVERIALKSDQPIPRSR